MRQAAAGVPPYYRKTDEGELKSGPLAAGRARCSTLSSRRPVIGLKFETTATKADAQVLLSSKAGKGLHGEDELGVKGASMMDSAHIFLPTKPTINATKDGTSIGDPVKRHILVHELIHAVGLTNSEHADDGGVFVKSLIIAVGTRHGKQQSADGSDSVPEIKLATSTVRALRQAWPN